jgi:hypothetical protein
MVLVKTFGKAFDMFIVIEAKGAPINSIKTDTQAPFALGWDGVDQLLKITTSPWSRVTRTCVGAGGAAREKTRGRSSESAGATVRRCRFTESSENEAVALAIACS